ncbi:MAG: hypothetical protein ACJA2S_003124, partial [Cyclobacteriaceae bacterium]
MGSLVLSKLHNYSLALDSNKDIITKSNYLSDYIITTLS